jgi:hypothetical protein
MALKAADGPMGCGLVVGQGIFCGYPRQRHFFPRLA